MAATESANAPESFYKYVAPDVLLKYLLPGKQIRFTQPEAFNDPFEMLPYLEELVESGAIETYYSSSPSAQNTAATETLNKMMEDAVLKNFPSGQLRSYVEQAMPSTVRFLSNMFNPIVEAVSKSMRQGLYDGFNKNVAVLCLSKAETPNNLLMWSHYADCHRGFAIEFDPNHPYFDQRKSDSDELRVMTKVTYTPTRPHLHPAQLNYKDLCLTKSSEWEYENEWRMVVSIADSTDSSDKDWNGYQVHLYGLPPDCIRGITIGSRTNPESQATLLNILNSDPTYDHIRVRKAALDEKTYSLRFSDVPRFTGADIRSLLEELQPLERCPTDRAYTKVIDDLMFANIFSLNILRTRIESYRQSALEDGLNEDFSKKEDRDPIDHYDHIDLIRSALRYQFGETYDKFCQERMEREKAVAASAPAVVEKKNIENFTTDLKDIWPALFGASNDEMQAWQKRSTLEEARTLHLKGKQLNLQSSEITSSPLFVAAWKAASERNASVIECSHLLLGIIRLCKRGARLLGAMCDIRVLEASIIASLDSKPSHTNSSATATLSYEAAVILGCANRLASLMHMPPLQSDVLLQELLRIESSTSSLLSKNGVEFERFLHEYQRRWVNIADEQDREMFEEVPIEQWKDQVFHFLPTHPKLQHYGYQNFAISCDDYVGRTFRVESIEGADAERLVTIMMTDTFHTLHGIVRDNCINGAGFLADFDDARLVLKGRTVFPRISSAGTYNEETGEFGEILFERYSPVKIIDVVAGWYEHSPIRLNVQAPTGEIGFIDVTAGPTNVPLHMHRFCGIEDLVLLDDPRNGKDWPNDIWTAICNWEVLPGMTEEQVRISWGEPDAVSGEGDVIRTYSRGNIHFQGGIVRAVELKSDV